MYAAHLSIFEILDTVKEDFTRLTHLESNGWVHVFLREKAQAAFEKDHTIFKNEALLATLDNVVLGKLVMKWVAEIYDDKIQRMLAAERVMEADAKDWMDKYTSVLQKLHNAGCVDEVQQDVVDEQELVTPVVDECCVQEASEHGSVETDGFCTISCPSVEGAEQEDGVVVDEGDLSGSIELVNNEVGETEAVCEEAVREEAAAVEPEPVPVEEEAVVDPVWKPSGNKKKKLLQIRMRKEARRKENEEAMRIEEENAAEVERTRLEETRLRKEEEEDAAAIAAMRAQVEVEEAKLRDVTAEDESAAIAAAADAVALEIEHISDAEPKVCRFRAKHMVKEKRWMKCSSCRAAVQHMAVRLSRTNVDEETLQDLEKELII
jgi:hypothetical protein